MKLDLKTAETHDENNGRQHEKHIYDKYEDTAAADDDDDGYGYGGRGGGGRGGGGGEN